MTAARYESVRWRAPGRVNLIGEHTDYNEGLAMPLAIDRTCAASARPLDEPILLLRSVQHHARASLALTDLAPGRPDGWAGYIGGVIWALLCHGIKLPGLAVQIDSNVPIGAGLSSSAALTCSVASCINDLLGLGLDRRDLLEIVVSAENNFVGAPTGGMDQLAALHGKDGNVLFCDMRTLAVTPIPFDLTAAGLSLLAIDTGISHSHAGGEYGARRAGCEQAAETLGVRALRDVTDLGATLAMLPDGPLQGYVRHVVTENGRVLRTAELLSSGAVRQIGPLLNASHAASDAIRQKLRRRTARQHGILSTPDCRGDRAGTGEVMADAH